MLGPHQTPFAVRTAARIFFAVLCSVFTLASLFAASYTNWAPGKPANLNQWGRDDCAFMDSGNGNLWDDKQCTHWRGIVCEKEA